MKGFTQIKVQGHLNTKWKEWFEGMHIIHQGDDTLITGYVTDESFLHGILNRIRDLNLILISINPTSIKEQISNNKFQKIKNYKTTQS